MQFFLTLKAKLDGEEAPKADGYSPVNTKDQELQTPHEAEENNTSAGTMEDAKQSAKPNPVLSITQLILRRGLAALVLLLILTTGVVLHIAFPIPERSAMSKMNVTMDWVNVSTPTPFTLLDLTTTLWVYLWCPTAAIRWLKSLPVRKYFEMRLTGLPKILGLRDGALTCSAWDADRGYKHQQGRRRHRGTFSLPEIVVFVSGIFVFIYSFCVLKWISYGWTLWFWLHM